MRARRRRVCARSVFRLQADLLTPLRGKPTSAPIHIPALTVPAYPVRSLDYLLEETQLPVVVAKAGVLINVILGRAGEVAE